MTRAEKTEAGLIAATVIVCAGFNHRFPAQLLSGYFILLLGLLFLVQTLIRDIWLLLNQRKIKREQMPTASCMCLESAIGFVPVIVAAILIAAGKSCALKLSSAIWLTSITLVLAAGFFLKDYVFEWNPWRIRRDPDHINFVFRFKR